MGTETDSLLSAVEEPPSCSPCWADWRWQLRNSVDDVEKLSKFFRLNAQEREELAEVAIKYPFSITPYYLSLIDKDNPDDPVRKQCVPLSKEGEMCLESYDDPLGEEHDSVLPGLVHRYPDRVLLTVTDMCPVYCRHCTRRREWCKGKWVRSEKELADIYLYIKLHPEIRDVIVSGGDPFVLSTHKLEEILKSLRDIPHVEIIRIGTRCPVVLPQRIDDELVSMLKKHRPVWVNTHFNHPKEITSESSLACDRILCAGIPVNNQSVLLKGINDDITTMTRLCQALLKIGVRPYYLFQCDPVSGISHLRTPVEKGVEIIRGMRGFTSGLAVPTFVVDGLEGQGKVPVQPDYLVTHEKDHVILKGYKGDTFRYYNPKG